MMMDAGSESRLTVDSKVVVIEAQALELPLLKPLVWARGREDSAKLVLVKVVTDQGVTGFAEIPSRPTIYGETLESSLSVLHDFLAPRVLGLELGNTDKLSSAMEGLAFNYATRAGLEMAWFDALGRTLGVSCATLLGASPHDIEVSARTRLAPADQMIAEATEAISRHGFRHLKVKVGAGVAQDMDALERLRAAVGPDIGIGIDINQAYLASDVIKVLPRLESIGITLIEEPIARTDVTGRKRIANATFIPILGDDSCMTLHETRVQLEARAIGRVSVKTARTGYLESKKIAALAEAFDIPIVNGGQADLQLGTACSAQFACSYQSTYPHELSMFLDAKEDILVTPLRVEQGFLKVPEGLGNGVEINEDQVAKYRKDGFKMSAATVS